MSAMQTSGATGLAMAVALAAGPAAADPTVDALYQQFRAGQFEPVYRGLLQWRQTHTTNSMVDYMLGVSACETGREAWGYKQLVVARAQYRATEPAGDATFAKAVSDCAPQAAAAATTGPGLRGGGSTIVMEKRKGD
jgi:hypothetical protein